MRALLALIAIAALVAAVAFFAERPGQVEIVWQGWQIETSVGVAVAALIAAALLLAGVLWLASALLRLPRNLRRRRQERRRRAGEAALTRALVALAAGNPAAAQLQARRAELLLGSMPAALLLAAEAAERQGDRNAARQQFAALAERPETALIGLRGLLGQALRDNEPAAALRIAERAQRLRPDVAWLTEALLALQARADAWEAARDTLAVAQRRGVIPRERARHHRGVVLHELSRAAERRGDTNQAIRLAARAQAQAPDLAAIAARHARLLRVAGRSRAAARAIERAWRAAPHPELARAYLEFDPEAGPLERAAAIERLASQNPDAVESHLALAEAALSAQLWGEARRHLVAAENAAGPGGPPRQLCLMLARLEESEGEAPGRAREWLDRAIEAPPDPCYVCAACGAASEEWDALCSECRGFDTLSWRRPERAGPAASGHTVLPPMLPGPGTPLVEGNPAKASDRLGAGTTIR